MKAFEHCPDPNLLAALADGRLAGAQRDRVLTHVNGCQRCFAIYRDALAYGEESGQAETAPSRRPRAIWWWIGPAGLAAAAALLLLVLPPLLQDEAQPWRQPHWWLSRSGEMDREEDLALRAEKVFQRVQRNVEGAAGWRLFLIEGGEQPLALALPGQGVVVNRGGLELCYQDGERGRGDARLAFLLGHELAHLEVEEDVHAFVAYQPQGGAEALRERNPDLGQRETRADQRGLVYASMAGFDPEILFDDGEAFFRRWVSGPVASAAYGSHPAPRQRARFVMDELSRVAAELDYFHYGLRFYQMGRYEEAISLLSLFQSLYPAREVLNNLGLAEFQIALRHLAACDGSVAMRFRLPLVMDSETLSEGVRRRGEESRSCLEVPLFRQHFSAAVSYFRRALDRDPEYLPALLNLFSSHAVAQEAAAALDLAERASALSSQDSSVLSARAVAIYLFAQDKGLQEDRLEAIGLLRDQMRRRPEAGSAYNLAVMLAESGLPAEDGWRRFLDLEAIGPYADYARERLGLEDAPSTTPPSFPEAPLPLGPVSPATLSRLEAMTSKELRLSAARTLTAYHDPSLRALTENGRITLVEERLLSPVAQDALAAQQQAWRRITTTRGEVLMGQGRMLETDGSNVVKRIWFE